MKVYYLLVSAFCVWIAPVHSQFFYSHYTPLTHVSPFFPQTYLPALPAVSPLTYSVPPSQPLTTPTSSVTYNIPPTPSAQFRGFGYRTDYNDGASSTVFYVTGPEAETLRNFKDFPSLSTRVQENTASAGKARSLASDLTDINAIPDAKGKIDSILQPADFQKIFENFTPGFVNFYTVPASTVPLALARQLLNETTNATTTTPSGEETVAAESVVNSKVVINDVDNIIKSNPTTESSTETSTETENSSTETSASPKLESKVDNVEPTTVSSTEEITTVETTTTHD